MSSRQCGGGVDSDLGERVVFHVLALDGSGKPVFEIFLGTFDYYVLSLETLAVYPIRKILANVEHALPHLCSDAHTPLREYCLPNLCVSKAVSNGQHGGILPLGRFH